jgi:hypothetical protein
MRLARGFTLKTISLKKEKKKEKKRKERYGVGPIIKVKL